MNEKALYGFLAWYVALFAVFAAAAVGSVHAGFQIAVTFQVPYGQSSFGEALFYGLWPPLLVERIDHKRDCVGAFVSSAFCLKPQGVGVGFGDGAGVPET